VNARDTLTVHQLLGRIVYFHALFIEPAVTAAGRPACRGDACCRHCRSVPATIATTLALPDTAWAAIGEIAATLPAGSCPGGVPLCCPTCQVLAAGTAIATCWIDVEHRAYGVPSTQQGGREAREEWSRAVAVRLAAAFSRQYGFVCAALARATALSSAMRPLLSERLPLTSELLALWADPTNHVPVTSWLNHCTELTDIARVVETRRTSR
jgi:hypothetical protein